MRPDLGGEPGWGARYEGHGYVYLANSLPPRLRAAGASDAEIETTTVGNPRRLLTIG